MVLKPSQFKSIMECGSDAERAKEIESMLTEEKDRLAFLGKGPRPPGFIGEIVEFEIRSRDFETAGTTEGPCVLMQTLETVNVRFKYKVGTSPSTLHDAQSESNRIEFLNIGGRYLIVEAPEMETFEALAQKAGADASAGGALSKSSLKACRAEVPSNVKAIKEAEMIYDAENDQFLVVASHPSATVPGKKAQKWTTTSHEFNALNWMPDGKVRGVYSVSTTPPLNYFPGTLFTNSRSYSSDFKVTGRIDCDGDGVVATYTATKSLNTKMTTASDIY
jgi:hypothetical protein